MSDTLFTLPINDHDTEYYTWRLVLESCNEFEPLLESALPAEPCPLPSSLELDQQNDWMTALSATFPDPYTDFPLSPQGAVSQPQPADSALPIPSHEAIEALQWRPVPPVLSQAEDGLSQNLGAAALGLSYTGTSSTSDVGGIASSPNESSPSASCSTPISSSPSDDPAADDPESSNDDDVCGDCEIKGASSNDSGIDNARLDAPCTRNTRCSRLRQHNAVEKRYRQTVKVAIEALGILIPPAAIPRRKNGHVKYTKAEILGQAATYIRTLQQEKNTLAAEKDHFRSLVVGYRWLLGFNRRGGERRAAGSSVKKTRQQQHQRAVGIGGTPSQ
ncbi:hypothetical protein PG987_004837 [Apiospora arundinis]